MFQEDKIKEKMTQYETKMKETIGKLLKTSMGIAFKPYGKQLMLSIRDMIPK